MSHDGTAAWVTRIDYSKSKDWDDLLEANGFNEWYRSFAKPTIKRIIEQMKEQENNKADASEQSASTGSVLITGTEVGTEVTTSAIVEVSRALTTSSAVAPTLRVFDDRGPIPARVFARRLYDSEVEHIVKLAREFHQKDSDEQAEAELRLYLRNLDYQVR